MCNALIKLFNLVKSSSFDVILRFYRGNIFGNFHEKLAIWVVRTVRLRPGRVNVAPILTPKFCSTDASTM